MKRTKVNFPKKAIEKKMLELVVNEQTKRLITYAEAEIKRIGNDISVAQTRNNLDRTGNMLDSLCWGVCYDGSMKEHGYYRGDTAFENSNLHEYSNPKGPVVDGYFMAMQFIAAYEPKHTNGWEVFFAVLAPYWGYWETGFTDKRSGRVFESWHVIANHYDIVTKDLKPAKVTHNIYRPS